jgi:hypothetical protein
MSRVNWRVLIPALLLIAVGFALRMAWLAEPDVAGDEAFNALLAGYQPGELLATLRETGEPTPPFAFWLQSISMLLFGHNSIGVRFVCVAASTLALPLIQRLARTLGMSLDTSVLCMLVLCVNPLAIGHAQWGRTMYALSISAALLFSLAVLSWLRQATARAFTMLVFSALGALMTHYQSVFVLVAINLFVLSMLIITRRWRTLSIWLCSQALTILAFALYLVGVGGALARYRGAGETIDVVVLLQRSFSVLLLGENSWRALPWISVWSASIVIIGFIALGRKNVYADQRAQALSVLWLGIPLFGFWASSQLRPIFFDRYLAQALVPFVFLATAALEAGFRTIRKSRLLFALGMVGVLLTFGQTAYTLQRYYAARADTKPRWRIIGSILRSLQGDLPQSEFRAVLDYPDPALAFYFGRDSAVLPVDPNFRTLAIETLDTFTHAGVKRVAILFTEPDAGRRIWLTSQVLKHFNRIGALPVADSSLEIFVRREVDELQPRDVHFNNGAVLINASAVAIPAANWMEVHTVWQNDGRFKGVIKLFIHITRVADPQRLQVAQLDQVFSASDLNGQVISYGFAMPELQPGAYEVRLGLYDPQLPDLPRATFRVGGNVSDVIVIGNFKK